MFIMAPCSKIWAHACNNRQRELYFCNLELLLQLIKQEEKHNQATTACCYYRILFPPKITVAGNATHGTDFVLFYDFGNLPFQIRQWSTSCSDGNRVWSLFNKDVKIYKEKKKDNQSEHAALREFMNT